MSQRKEHLEKCVCGHAKFKHENGGYNDAFQEVLYYDCKVKGCNCNEFGDLRK